MKEWRCDEKDAWLSTLLFLLQTAVLESPLTIILLRLFISCCEIK